MPIAVTCQCGAKLEIDEKFLGKVIQCPDCQRPLPTSAPAKPPPLDLPEYRRTEAFAVWSLTLALVGAFVPPFPIAAIVLGGLALGRIRSKPQKLGGANLARGGIVLGGFFLCLSIAAQFSPTVFGVDALLRDLAFGGRLNYLVDDPVSTNDVEIVRPPRSPRDWAKFNSSQQLQTGILIDHLILVNTRDDAYLAVLDVDITLVEARDEKVVFEKVIERVKKSELINLLDRPNRSTVHEITVVEKKAIDASLQELILDVRLGRHDRRLLVHYRPVRANRVFILVGCARKNWFDFFQDDFRKAFEKFKDKT